jgi:hypothetical protein
MRAGSSSGMGALGGGGPMDADGFCADSYDGGGSFGIEAEFAMLW